MNIPALDPETVACQVGADGIEYLVGHAERICAYEERRIELTNQGPIASLLEEHRHLALEDSRLVALLREAPPSGDRLRLLRRAIFCWTLTIGLAASGFALAILTLAPYRLGSKSWLYAVGVSILTPFLIDQVLSHWPVLQKFLTPVAAAAGLAGLMLFAAIRGNLLGQELRDNQASSVVLDDADPSQQAPAPQTDFYASTVPLLQLAFLLLAFSIEVGSGIALFEARRSKPNDCEDWGALRRELRDVHSRRGRVIQTAIALRNAPAIFAARFHRDFYLAMLTNAARKALPRVLFAVAVASALGASPARAQVGQDVVVALDLTGSVDIAGPDGKSDFQKDVDGVARLLAQTPTGSRVTVIGITDASFSLPYILMQARVGTDPGYFGERLGAARNELVRVWKVRSAHLTPSFRHSDILGAMELASQIFAEEKASRRELILLSDMRQHDAALNLESSAPLPKFSAVANRCAPTPDLGKVRVTVLGAGGEGQSTAYWSGLKAFWADYFRSSGAVLETYSALRQFPAGP